MRDQYSPALHIAYRRALRFHETRKSVPTKASATVDRLLEAFGGPMPEVGMAPATVIERLADAAEPGLTGTAGPHFFAWVMGASHPVGVAADWLTSMWGQNGAGYHSCPANAAAEAVASKWLLELLQLPPECSVGFTTGGTMSHFVCLAAARGELLRRQGWDVEADGLFGAPQITVCVGADAHVSVFSALRYLGFGQRRVVVIPTDPDGRMDPNELRRAIAKVNEPLLVIAQAGQINTGAFDPMHTIAESTHEQEGWLHVDGAFGLWARACPPRAYLAQGVEQADSWTTDGHKWLQAPYDCGFAIVRDASAHHRAMTVQASYLPVTGEAVRDPKEWVPELSRRARGFATWALLCAFGKDGISAMIEQHCQLAERMSAGLAREPGIHVLNKVELNQFLVRFGSAEMSEQSDQATKDVIAQLDTEGTVFFWGAAWKGMWVMRVSVISWATTEPDVDKAMSVIIEAWRNVKGKTEESGSLN
ncbi:aminotransferase class V-fold PLP-dependent enzyme [Paraburkholderia sp. SIMBA_055]